MFWKNLSKYKQYVLKESIKIKTICFERINQNKNNMFWKNLSKYKQYVLKESIKI